MASVEHVKKKKGVLADYLSTVDHKKIAILYLFSGLFFFMVGGFQALLIRLQLMFPNNDFLVGNNYNEVLTMHGTTMIFLAAMPLIFALMNAVVPLQIGARDVAFPFLNALGYWLYFFGGIILNLGWFMGGAPDAGWTSYTSLATQSPGHGVDFYTLGLQVSGFGTLIAGINFLVTILTMRAPGMTLMRMPLFTWSTFVVSGLILFAFPPLTVALFFLMFDRLFGANFFDVTAGGNNIIWEHIFWIFGHPEVYILILPAFGIFSEVIPTFSRKRLFGYSSMVFATVLIAFLGFMVWAHHMFTTGMGAVANSIFAITTMLISVPTGIKVFNWLLTMWGGVITNSVAMLWSIWFIPTFVAGGVTGVMLAIAPADYQFHDTYFVVAHFHYVIIGGTVFGIFAGIHYWWPKMFGTLLSETLGKITFWTFFVGFHLTFFIQHFLGLWGMPRRYMTYLGGQGFDTGNFVSSVGAFFMGFGSLIFLINIIYTLMKGEKVGPDPWGTGRSLEWGISSPPPEYNFKQLPLIKSLDPVWEMKMEGKTDLIPAEPVQDIHMPNSSFLPIILSFGLFIASVGFIYHADIAGGILIGIGGLAIILIAMLLRSIRDDFGYHIHKEELDEEG